MIFLLKKNIKRAKAFVRSVFPINNNGIRVLMYHSIGGVPRDHRIAIRVPSKNFTSQLEELKSQGYCTVTVSELLESSLSPRMPKTIAITFDDGYKDNVTKAAVALVESGMKATFFISTSRIGGEDDKRWTNGSPREYMNWKDIARLGKMGFEIGSHMIDHVDLSLLADDELFRQLEGSKIIITNNAGIAPKVCSYPYGGQNERVVIMAKKAGYIGCCSSIAGLNTALTDHFTLRRTEIDGYDTINDFKCKLSGYYD